MFEGLVHFGIYRMSRNAAFDVPGNCEVDINISVSQAWSRGMGWRLGHVSEDLKSDYGKIVKLANSMAADFLAPCVLLSLWLYHSSPYWLESNYKFARVHSELLYWWWKLNERRHVYWRIPFIHRGFCKFAHSPRPIKPTSLPEPFKRPLTARIHGVVDQTSDKQGWDKCSFFRYGNHQCIL